MADWHEDDLFDPLSELVASWMAGLEDAVASDAWEMVRPTEIAIDIPIELQFATRDGALDLRASPPTQKTATTILPVWHQLSVRYELGEA